MDNSSNNNKELHSRLAALESHVDMLESELTYLNHLLIKCGFPEGVDTLKETVEELLLEDHVVDDKPEAI